MSCSLEPWSNYDKDLHSLKSYHHFHDNFAQVHPLNLPKHSSTKTSESIINYHEHFFSNFHNNPIIQGFYLREINKNYAKNFW